MLRHIAVPSPWLRLYLVALASVVAGAHPSAADFVDRSSTAGVGLSNYTYGVAWSDLDGDGDLDLFTGRHFDPPALYVNQGNGSFVYDPTLELFDPNDHHGAVIADFDNDGDPDIYLTAGAQGGGGSEPKFFYRNDGGLNFQDIALESGLQDPTGRGRACSAMDVNLDGFLDIFVAKAEKASDPNSLFLSDGAGGFVDVAASAGVDDAFGSAGGVWGDYDRDGDADLFVAGFEAASSTSRLYRNNGDLTFTDVTATKLPSLDKVSAAAWADFDNDGDLDLAVGLGDEAVYDAVDTDFGSLRFFLNARSDENGIDSIEFNQFAGNSITFDILVKGAYDSSSVFLGASGLNPETNGPFTVSRSEVAGQPTFVAGVSVGLFIWTEGNRWKIRGSTPAGIGTNFGGVLDVSGFVFSVSTSDLEPYLPGPRGTRLFRNDNGTFNDVSQQLGIDDNANVRAITWIDYDKDGRLDLHVLAKGDTKDQNEPDILYRNVTTAFQDVTGSEQAFGPTAGLADGCAFDDADGDGDLDFATVSGAPPRLFALQETDRYYENLSSPGNFLRIDLEGTISNRDGIGAWVTCVTPGAGAQARYVAANAWGGSQVMLDPHFGLGSDTSASLVRVDWPSGIVTEHFDVPAGNFTIVETSDALDASVASPLPKFTARPLPSRGEVDFVIPQVFDDEASLEIYDSRGRRVFERTILPGVSNFSWSGRDLAGYRVASGVYYGVLTSARESSRTKIVLLR